MKSQDLCEKVTAAIIAELETGVMPWSKPWAGQLVWWRKADVSIF
jgi:antirestriction protein ArdC